MKGEEKNSVPVIIMSWLSSVVSVVSVTSSESRFNSVESQSGFSSIMEGFFQWIMETCFQRGNELGRIEPDSMQNSTAKESIMTNFYLWVWLTVTIFLVRFFFAGASHARFQKIPCLLDSLWTRIGIYSSNDVDENCDSDRNNNGNGNDSDGDINRSDRSDGNINRSDRSDSDSDRSDSDGDKNNNGNNVGKHDPACRGNNVGKHGNGSGKHDNGGNGSGHGNYGSGHRHSTSLVYFTSSFLFF